VCIDYDKFDAHMSSIDVFDIKRRLARDTPITWKHLNYERFDYPLKYPQQENNVVDRCNKLCSGDYLTSFCSTFFQIATYRMLNKTMNIDDYMCGGDDAALLIGDTPIAKMEKGFEKGNAVVDMRKVIKESSSKSDMYNKMIKLYFAKYTGDEISLSKSYLDVVAYNRRI